MTPPRRSAHPSWTRFLPKYLTADQAVELLDVCRNQGDFPERDYCMVTLFLNCGMRLAELVGMNLDDIDLPGRQIRLFGKGHKEADGLPERCLHRGAGPLSAKAGDSGGAFSQRGGGVHHPAAERPHLQPAVEQIITGAMKAAGLVGYSTHKLRHTAATLMYQTGTVDVLTLKEVLGHST